MNKVILMGSLATEPESAQTGGGIQRTTFRIAVRRKYKNSEGNYEADFLTVICWRGTAELASRYLHKGAKVCVIGSIQTRSWTANDGGKRYATEIVADELEFVGSGAGARPSADGEVHNEEPKFTPVDDDEELPFE